MSKIIVMCTLDKSAHDAHICLSLLRHRKTKAGYYCMLRIFLRRYETLVSDTERLAAIDEY